MIIERLFPSGAYAISALMKTQLVRHVYMGYTRNESIQQFKAEMKETAMYTIPKGTTMKGSAMKTIIGLIIALTLSLPVMALANSQCQTCSPPPRFCSPTFPCQ